MFTPIVPPPTEHHQFSTGHSTENGDNAKTVGEKINAGFMHVYGVLRGLGATLADEIEYVAKSEFDALVHELGETKAELANLKMMVQGLGFAGVMKDKKIDGPLVSITEPVAVHEVTKGMTGLSWDGMTGSSEPLVTVTEQELDPDGKPATGGTPEPTVTVKEAGAQ